MGLEEAHAAVRGVRTRRESAGQWGRALLVAAPPATAHRCPASAHKDGRRRRVFEATGRAHARACHLRRPCASIARRAHSESRAPGAGERGWHHFVHRGVWSASGCVVPPRPVGERAASHGNWRKRRTNRSIV